MITPFIAEPTTRGSWRLPYDLDSVMGVAVSIVSPRHSIFSMNEPACDGSIHENAGVRPALLQMAQER